MDLTNKFAPLSVCWYRNIVEFGHDGSHPGPNSLRLAGYRLLYICIYIYIIITIYIYILPPGELPEKTKKTLRHTSSISSFQGARRIARKVVVPWTVARIFQAKKSMKSRHVGLFVGPETGEKPLLFHF